jgi:hypothetical protein
MTESEYIRTVGETFIELRKGSLALSPLDADLIQSWADTGIPLNVVLGAMCQVLEREPKDGKPARPIRTIKYCEEEVEAQFADWQEMRVGASEEE